jgi:hypothetical protein
MGRAKAVQQHNSYKFNHNHKGADMTGQPLLGEGQADAHIIKCVFKERDWRWQTTSHVCHHIGGGYKWILSPLNGNLLMFLSTWLQLPGIQVQQSTSA